MTLKINPIAEIIDNISLETISIDGVSNRLNGTIRIIYRKMEIIEQIL